MLVGLDGCPGGWIAVAGERGDPERLRVEVVPDLAALEARLGRVSVLAVDMPIGLPARIGPVGRGPEKALRPLLGARQSSVFAVPARAAVYAADYREACAAALATSDPPRKVSKQCFFLFPKIRELDQWIRAEAGRADRVFECHPEGAFMMLNGHRPLTEPKKVKSRPHGPGLAQRRGLLSAAGVAEDVIAGPVPRGAAADDLLDACACFVVAGRIARGEARPYPARPERDDLGLPMAIWA